MATFRSTQFLRDARAQLSRPKQFLPLIRAIKVKTECASILKSPAYFYCRSSGRQRLLDARESFPFPPIYVTWENVSEHVIRGESELGDCLILAATTARRPRPQFAPPLGERACRSSFPAARARAPLYIFFPGARYFRTVYRALINHSGHTLINFPLVLFARPRRLLQEERFLMAVIGLCVRASASYVVKRAVSTQFFALPFARRLLSPIFLLSMYTLELLLFLSFFVFFRPRIRRLSPHAMIRAKKQDSWCFSSPSFAISIFPYFLLSRSNNFRSSKFWVI